MKIAVDSGERADPRRRSPWTPAATKRSTCVLDVMYAKAPYTVLQRAAHIRPAVSEVIPTILGELKPL